MGRRIIDLTGKRFGKLTVLERGIDRKHASGQTKIMWKCLCDCGNTCEKSGTDLRLGKTNSCGCKKR